MTVIRYGVDLTGGDGGYFVRPWIGDEQAEPARGDVFGPIPSRADAEELQRQLAAQMKAGVERQVQAMKLRLKRSEPLREFIPGGEAQPFQWPDVSAKREG